MHPEDMNFKVVQMQGKTFDTMLEKVASFSPDENPEQDFETCCYGNNY